MTTGYFGMTLRYNYDDYPNLRTPTRSTRTTEMGIHIYTYIYVYIPPTLWATDVLYIVPIKLPFPLPSNRATDTARL